MSEGSYDIYIRMKASADSDYCITVTKRTSFLDLLKIFKTIPVMFSPSIFYDKIPTHFAVSKHPGLLTRTGGVLFKENLADDPKFLEPIYFDEQVQNILLPGQLLVPVFRERTIFHYSTIAFFLLWLLTDLPEYISPYPNFTLTYGTTRVIYLILTYLLNKPDKALAFYNEMHSETPIVGQWIYFAFHVFKLLMFYFILWAGLFNPYSWFRPSLNNLTREKLVEIGWTGVKKASVQLYQDEFRKTMVKHYGSIINLYKEGKLPYIQYCTYDLPDGEYYSQYGIPNIKNEKFETLKKFLVEQRSYYFAKASSINSEKESDLYIKKFRQFGPMELDSKYAKLADEKFHDINEMIAEREKENKNKSTYFNKSLDESKKQK